MKWEVDFLLRDHSRMKDTAITEPMIQDGFLCFKSEDGTVTIINTDAITFATIKDLEGWEEAVTFS